MRKTKNNRKLNTLDKSRRKLYSKRKGRGIGASKVSARPYGRLLRMEAVKDDLEEANVEVERAKADRVVARAIAVTMRDAGATVDTMSDDEQIAFLAMSAIEQRAFLGISDDSSPMSAARVAVYTTRKKAANQYSLGRYVVIGG
jgi:hypothetical protein